MNTTADAIALRSKDFYESYDINVQTNKEVSSIPWFLNILLQFIHICKVDFEDRIILIW